MSNPPIFILPIRSCVFKLMKLVSIIAICNIILIYQNIQTYDTLLDGVTVRAIILLSKKYEYNWLLRKLN